MGKTSLTAFRVYLILLICGLISALTLLIGVGDDVKSLIGLFAVTTLGIGGVGSGLYFLSWLPWNNKPFDTVPSKRRPNIYEALVYAIVILAWFFFLELLYSAGRAF